MARVQFQFVIVPLDTTGLAHWVPLGEEIRVIRSDPPAVREYNLLVLFIFISVTVFKKEVTLKEITHQ